MDTDLDGLSEVLLLASEELRAIAEGTRKLLEGEPNDTVVPPSLDDAEVLP